ncbi:MAG: galactose-1-phosphate uridylyltransferase [Candidatus Margulisiibacteriota bacterium]|nr:MAG: galactose-1-phosphate uridylyltransferase [Candidatus Margulisbacteria bacterium GWD2_39_127]OGI03562.1 MAG: galactose-1-phosphate uridylyltransferase [Candidatus Margulisbacteria bacterium GWF2_38_17]OGI11067.1 MAG: galactose-1-phosphate uridylyltransferase [Candidatus Margulisbacteria bacterium GWE2_39_32]PZM80177.1 MAG: galactose-1-phosphate uridylyltransferase [Candidatus Margulisiibacteriota bacterium]HAR62339.1 galactose-1-phosphate uridylyltransferase [Candidatus Margulisiibacter
MTSDMRQNPATKEWVVITDYYPEKPSDYGEELSEGLPDAPEYDTQCPFCPGNEISNEEIFSIREDGRWLIRAVNNKYPNLSPAPKACASKKRTSDGIFVSMSGCGHHEVIIEHPVHNKTIGTMTVKEVERILSVYLRRYNALANDPIAHLITIFRNNGKPAGSSLRHPHSQIISTKVVPLYIRSQLYEAEHYFDDEGLCIYCAMLENELRVKERIIFENADFVVFVPFAAGIAYETMVMPRRHSASFGNLRESEIRSCAEALRFVTAKMVKNLNNPSYNYLIRTAPVPLSVVPFYHWYINIMPKTHPLNGFESGTGIRLSSFSPEQAAARLRF